MTAYVDANGNGMRDTGDAAKQSVQVYLDKNDDGKLDAGDVSKRTHSNGRATFTGVAVGTYVIRIATPSGYTVSGALRRSPPSPPIRPAPSPSASPCPAPATSAAPAPAPSAAWSPATPTATASSTTATAPLGGHHVWLDLNGDGVEQSYEPTATTHAGSGKFLFSDIPAGTYAVDEVVPSGKVQTAPLTDENDYTVKAGQTRVVTFLLHTGTAAAGTASITGSIVDDKNGNGVANTGEVGLAGRTVYLDTNANGVDDSTEPSTTTDSTGAFSFAGLAAGSYVVRTVLTKDWSYTGAAASAALQVTLDDGQAATGVTITEMKG